MVTYHCQVTIEKLVMWSTFLQQLRRIILETVPGAEETMQYNMPYYTYQGMLCAFASQKHYMSFYLLEGEIVEAGLSICF